MKKKMTKKRIKKEFSDPEIETWVQDFRRACSEEPDDNEELFPNDMNEVNSHVSVLEDPWLLLENLGKKSHMEQQF